MPEIAYEPSHLMAIDAQPGQRADADRLQTWPVAEQMAKFDTFSIQRQERIIGVYGFIPCWPGCSIIWFLGDGGMGAQGFMHTHHVIARKLDRRTEHRIEAHAVGEPNKTDFPQSHRWLRRLGFTFEMYFEGFMPDKTGMSQYVLLRV